MLDRARTLKVIAAHCGFRATSFAGNGNCLVPSHDRFDRKNAAARVFHENAFDGAQADGAYSTVLLVSSPPWPLDREKIWAVQVVIWQITQFNLTDNALSRTLNYAARNNRIDILFMSVYATE